VIRLFEPFSVPLSAPSITDSVKIRAVTLLFSMIGESDIRLIGGECCGTYERTLYIFCIRSFFFVLDSYTKHQMINA